LGEAPAAAAVAGAAPGDTSLPGTGAGNGETFAALAAAVATLTDEVRTIRAAQHDLHPPPPPATFVASSVTDNVYIGDAVARRALRLGVDEDFPESLRVKTFSPKPLRRHGWSRSRPISTRAAHVTSRV